MKGSDLLNRITEARRSQAPTTRFVLGRDELVGQQLLGCGSWLHLREFLTTGETRLVNAKFCKRFRLCRSCAIRRAGRLTESYLPKVESLLQADSTLIPAMVTLTVKNGEDLLERINHLKQSWRLMLAAKRRGASESSRNAPVQWNRVEGSLRAIEITRGRGGWHPHAHCFVLLRDYIDQAELSREWEQWTGDSKIVGVTKCKNGVLPGLLEVLKYAIKFSDLTDGELWEAHLACNGTRSVDPQGCLRGVPEPDIDQDSLEGLSGPYRDIIARWLWSQMKYELEFLEATPEAQTHALQSV